MGPCCVSSKNDPAESRSARYGRISRGGRAGLEIFLDDRSVFRHGIVFSVGLELNATTGNVSMTEHQRVEFQRLLAEIRPKLHRYCARMVGSTVEGEDIVQDALIKAIDALITGATPAAAKSALQRGRERLRQLAAEVEDVSLPMLSDELRERLNAYVDGFRSGDFDAVRRMLADDVKLELVGKFSAQGKNRVGEYYGRYAAAAEQWAYAAGMVEGRPAMLVFDRNVSLDAPAYFVALTFAGDRVVAIHDFLFARYALEGVTAEPL
jgi:hypothetical protein